MNPFLRASFLVSVAIAGASSGAIGQAPSARAAGDPRPAPAASAHGPQASAQHDLADLVPWNARTAEHLLNRAGFGARQSDIDAAVALGARACVERLLTERADVDPYFLDQYDVPGPRQLRELPEEEREKVKRDRREADRRQITGYTVWWFDRMQSGDDPLLEKMVLFWHGFFTTSSNDVKRTYEVLRQNQFVRERALGSYADLLRGMARDPAMLTYLDNQVNRKESPNENFARELFELFSLGEGNYTEDDVKEAARALTGRGTNARGAYEFHPRQHDDGEKTILGVAGKHDGDALIGIILKHPACARHVARRLLNYLEGVEPDAERLERYAQCLRDERYEIVPFLRRLFLDPEFYRPEILGARVQGPVEYMVGMARRLDARVSAPILVASTTLLGQRLFAPPSVKGWDEGEAWITTSSLMQRGNLAGVVLGLVDVDDVLSAEPMEAADPDAPMTGEMTMEGSSARTGESGAKEGEKREPDKRDGGRDVARGKDRAKDAPVEGTKPADANGAAPKKPKANKAGTAAYQALRRIENAGWTPPVNFTARLKKLGLKSDAEIVDRMVEDLLAVQAPHDTRERLRQYLTRERATLGLREEKLLEGGADVEHVLRRLAHLILSLPEAQLS